MCVLAFNRLIALYLLLLHALVFTNTCAELDKLMHVDNAGATPPMVVLCIRPLIHLYFRLSAIWPEAADLAVRGMRPRTLAGADMLIGLARPGRGES